MNATCSIPSESYDYKNKHKRINTHTHTKQSAYTFDVIQIIQTKLGHDMDETNRSTNRPMPHVTYIQNGLDNFE